MKEKKKILIFSTAYFPLVGGAEVAVKEITDRIENYQFDMVTARMDRKNKIHEKIGNINVYRVGFGIPTIDKLWLALFGYRKALKLHKQKKYCFVWSIMASYGGFAALRFKEVSGVKFLLTLQEGDSIDYILDRVRFVKRRFKKIFEKADALQAISHYLLGWGEDMGFRGGIKQVVPNGVDIKKFLCKFDPEDIKKERHKFGFKGNPTILITVSRLVKKNGVGIVIKALKKLPENICFVICGSGKLEEDLKKLTRDLNLESRVKFLGSCSHDELPQILKASDIFVRPSLSEGLGNSFLEAMAVGLPVVGTLVGGIPDFLKDDKTGFVCKTKDYESVARTVSKVLDLSAKEQEKVVRNAREIVKNKYSWDFIVGDMENIFNKLTSDLN